MSQWDKIAKANEFILIDVITGERLEGEGENRKKVPVIIQTIIPMHHIKAISVIVREESIIQSLEEKPEAAMCAMELITGGQAILPYSIEEVCQVLGATDANKILAALREKSGAALQ